MSSKKYKLTFKLYDGTTDSVVFEVPQGEPGPRGELGPRGETGPMGEPGHDATDEQVAKAVADYLAEHLIETDHTLTLENGVLSVNTTSEMEQDNTLPITSAGVFATVGNIEALLKTI